MATGTYLLAETPGGTTITFEYTLQQAPLSERLAAAVARACAGGISDLSLRRIAVEQQQREALTALGADPSLTPTAAAMRMWERFADPALWPLERLFFDLYAQALQGKEHLAGFLDTALEPWFAPTVKAQLARGMPPDQARALARLGVVTTRGLLLDLLATGDRAGVDAAMRMFLDWYENAVAVGACARACRNG